MYGLVVLRLLALGALAAALVLPGTAPAAEQKRALFFSPATVLENGAMFSDPAGDSDFVPDIVSVSVSNDNAGKIAFKVGFANRAIGSGKLGAAGGGLGGERSRGEREDRAQDVAEDRLVAHG